MLPVLYTLVGEGDLFLKGHMNNCMVSSLLLYIGLMMAHKYAETSHCGGAWGSIVVKALRY